MEIIMISENKLKLMLTRRELEEFDLEAEELDYSKTETKRMFWDILNRLKHSVGFQTDGCRVLVQLFPSKDGGCEMFITKIADLRYHSPIQSTAKPEELDIPILHYKPSHHIDQNGKIGAFGFDRLNWLIMVCRRLMGIGYAGKSSAYISDDRRFYLFLDGLDPTGYLPLDEYSFIAEYGNMENVEALQDFLCEHGKPLCERDAVEQLGVL